MPLVNLNNQLLFCKLIERKALRDILLLHGSGADYSHWPAELTALSACNIHYLDLPGHGQSTGTGCDSVAAYADAVTGYIAARGLQRVILFGHSLGSAIVQALALRQPAWLEAIVLVGAGARLKVVPALLEQLETDFPAAVESLCGNLFGPQAPAQLVEAERRRLLSVDWRLIRADLIACDQFDVMQRLGEIAVPTLVVTGAADRMTPVKYGQFLKDNIPGACLVVIPDAGHMVARERPAAFVQAVAGFVAAPG